MNEKYDERGNLIYAKNSLGYECWKEYDKKNNCIYYKNNHGCESWQEYDERGNCTYLKDSGGNEYYYKYNENNNGIKISQKEFEKIKRKKYREIVNNSKISRFELMDI